MSINLEKLQQGLAGLDRSKPLNPNQILDEAFPIRSKIAQARPQTEQQRTLSRLSQRDMSQDTISAPPPSFGRNLSNLVPQGIRDSFRRSANPVPAGLREMGQSIARDYAS
jgi:hypothetical protein